MNKYKAIKYGILAILGVFAVYQIFPIRVGDYCAGLMNAIMFVFLGGLFLFSFLVFIVIDLIRTIKNKVKFDYIPCIFLIVFIAVNFLSFQIKTEKFWTKPILTGYVVLGEDLFSAEHLILYENKTFAIKKRQPEFTCTYQGKYSIKQDTLILKRDDLSELTNKLFCNKYLIHQIDSTLIPLENGYKIIDLKKYETNSKLNLNLKKATQ